MALCSNPLCSLFTCMWKTIPHHHHILRMRVLTLPCTCDHIDEKGTITKTSSMNVTYSKEET